MTTHHENYHTRTTSVTPDVQLHGGAHDQSIINSERLTNVVPTRMLMRSFSVDESTHACHVGNHFHSTMEKPCSDYDNVSKYLMNPNSAENIDKSRLTTTQSSDGIHDHFQTPLNLLPDIKCQPFPTNPQIHLSKPNEPRVTFNEPIAETKTFHDPRLDDDEDDDYDDDSNVSSVGNHSSESNSIIYANNVIQNELSTFQTHNTDSPNEIKEKIPSPKKSKSSQLRSPPPPSIFRSSSSTSSNASSSPSSNGATARFKMSAHHSSDTSSNSSCSSAATISLPRHRVSANFNSIEKDTTKSPQLTNELCSNITSNCNSQLNTKHST